MASDTSAGAMTRGASFSRSSISSVSCATKVGVAATGPAAGTDPVPATGPVAAVPTLSVFPGWAGGASAAGAAPGAVSAAPSSNCPQPRRSARSSRVGTRTVLTTDTVRPALSAASGLIAETPRLGSSSNCCGSGLFSHRAASPSHFARQASGSVTGVSLCAPASQVMAQTRGTTE